MVVFERNLGERLATSKIEISREYCRVTAPSSKSDLHPFIGDVAGVRCPDSLLDKALLKLAAHS